MGKELARHFDSGFDAMMLMIRGADLDEVFARAEAATEGARRLAREGAILGYSGLTSLLPSPARQREALEWLEAGRASGRLDPERIAEEFRSALAEEGMRAEPFEHGLELFGLQMNFMNVFVTTMIIGIGVDYGIHAVHRYREADGGGVDRLGRGLVETGKAIVVASLSTVVGFGSLATSRYPGLRSTGFVAVLGTLATALVAITPRPTSRVVQFAGIARNRYFYQET